MVKLAFTQVGEAFIDNKSFDFTMFYEKLTIILMNYDLSHRMIEKIIASLYCNYYYTKIY